MGFKENYKPLIDELLAKLALEGYAGPVKVGLLCGHVTSGYARETYSVPVRLRTPARPLAPPPT